MRKRLSLMIILIGLLVAGEIRAQQPKKNSSQADESNAKSCVVVCGAVRAPVRLELRRRVRLAEVLAMAGGLTERASRTVQVVHSDAQCFQPGIPDRAVKDADPSGKLDTYDLSELLRSEERANPYLRAGDIVIVTELDPIYIIGAVANPREIYLNKPLTLTEALKLAGDVRSDAKISKVIIHRQKKGSIEGVSITVDLGAVRKHRAEDPILQLYDIVEVPSLGARRVGPPISYPTFDSRPLIPLGYSIIY